MQIKTIIPVSELRNGDTVEIDGVLKTVNRNHISHSNFLGWAFQGALYPQGITRVTFKVPTAFGFRYQ